MEFNPFHADDPGLPDAEDTHGGSAAANPGTESPQAPFTGFAVHPSLMPAPSVSSDEVAPASASASSSLPNQADAHSEIAAATDSGATSTPQEPVTDSTAADDDTSENQVLAGISAEVRQRRVVAVLALAAIVVFTGAAFTIGLPGAAPDTTAQSQTNVRLNAAAVPGQAQARGDLDKAARWYRTRGTFLGLTSPGANIAGNDQRWTASRLTEGTCLTYSGTAATPAKATDILVDPSGKACAPAAVSAAAAELAAEQKQVDKAALADAGNALANFAVSIAQYTQANPNGLLGIPDIGAQENITVVANTGSVLTARYATGEVCIDAVIDAAGTIYDSYRCP